MYTNLATMAKRHTASEIGVSAGTHETGSAYSPKNRLSVLMNDIHFRAYEKWLAAGKPDGDCTRFWLEAEHDLLQGE